MIELSEPRRVNQAQRSSLSGDKLGMDLVSSRRSG
jgi:hypothetical protein